MQQTASRAEIAVAMQLNRSGQPAEALRRLRDGLPKWGEDPHALHAIASIELQEGRAGEAARYFARAAAADPGAPTLWMALARAQRATNEIDAELASLDRALALDPYLLPALLQKAQALERARRVEEAANVYRALLKTTPSDEGLPAPIAAALAHGRTVIAEDDDRRAAAAYAAVQPLLSERDAAASFRMRAYVDHLGGKRRIYFPDPTGPLFPFLPPYEFFPRDLFPWFAQLEAATAILREEFVALRRGDRRFEPYVQFPDGVPTNQWEALNHSTDWGVFFLWRDGVRVDENIALCPNSTAALEQLPMLDVPRRAPSVMFSILEPRTRIPAHTGVTNTRSTIHLPLIVPPGCGFRVGGETREWREGEAWAFDDTIEHEAWNDSDQPRVILIIDGWNPFLTDLEREGVRALARGAPASS